jgi:hypothetical protein
MKGIFMTKKFAYRLSLLSVFALLLMHTATVGDAFAVERAAENAITRAQEIAAELDEAIKQAEDLLLQARTSRDNKAYQLAERTKNAASLMLRKAELNLDDAVKMAPNDPAATAASYSSRAKAAASQSFARVGLLYLEALKFAANGDISCSEKINSGFYRDKKAWKDLEKIEGLAGESFNSTRSAFKNTTDAATQSEESVKIARHCIALAGELAIQLQDLEDTCNDFRKRWKDIKDQEDDEEPSPV